MHFINQARVVAVCALLLFLIPGCGQKQEAAPASRTGRQVVDSMRLKRLTKDLQLTQEQQDQVKPLLEAESKKIEEANANTELSMNQRIDRYAEFRSETYSKIKALLTPEQLPQFERVLAQVNGKKK